MNIIITFSCYLCACCKKTVCVFRLAAAKYYLNLTSILAEKLGWKNFNRFDKIT